MVSASTTRLGYCLNAYPSLFCGQGFDPTGRLFNQQNYRLETGTKTNGKAKINDHQKRTGNFLSFSYTTGSRIGILLLQNHKTHKRKKAPIKPKGYRGRIVGLNSLPPVFRPRSGYFSIFLVDSYLFADSYYRLQM